MYHLLFLADSLRSSSFFFALLRSSPPQLRGGQAVMAVLRFQKVDALRGQAQCREPRCVRRLNEQVHR